jgi:hypothetical protein
MYLFRSGIHGRQGSIEVVEAQCVRLTFVPLRGKTFEIDRLSADEG